MIFYALECDSLVFQHVMKFRVILEDIVILQHNLCAWPQCDQPCENFATFLHHLATAHTLDERSAQQCRAQIEVVDNLEHRLNKERSRLQAMMQHLHMKQSPDTTTPTLGTLPQAQDATSVSSPALGEPKVDSLSDQVGSLFFSFFTFQNKKINRMIVQSVMFCWDFGIRRCIPVSPKRGRAQIECSCIIHKRFESLEI